MFTVQTSVKVGSVYFCHHHLPPEEEPDDTHTYTHTPYEGAEIALAVKQYSRVS